MKKVFLISPLPPPPGGIETFSDSLIRYFNGSGNGSGLMHYNTTHRFRRVTSDSVAVRLFSGITNALGTIRAVEKTLRKSKPGVIHLSSSASLALLKDHLILIMASRFKIPVVMHWHFGRIPDLYREENREWKYLVKVIRKSTHSIVIDEKSLHVLKDAGVNNVSYIPNPLPGYVEQKARELALKTEKMRKNRILFVGHIIKNKGVYELVEVCASLEEVRELVFIGPVEERVKNELNQMARRREDGTWLTFTGPVIPERVLDLMATSTVLALPSYTEGFPMVILEAMAMGCAVIATPVGAIPEMLAVNTPEPCGICVPPKNTRKLQAAVSKLLRNPAEAEALGRRGEQLVLRRYSMEMVYRQYRAVWEKVGIPD